MTWDFHNGAAARADFLISSFKCALCKQVSCQSSFQREISVPNTLPRTCLSHLLKPGKQENRGGMWGAGEVPSRAAWGVQASLSTTHPPRSSHRQGSASAGEAAATRQPSRNGTALGIPHPAVTRRVDSPGGITRTDDPFEPGRWGMPHPSESDSAFLPHHIDSLPPFFTFHFSPHAPGCGCALRVSGWQLTPDPCAAHQTRQIRPRFPHFTPRLVSSDCVVYCSGLCKSKYNQY